VREIAIGGDLDVVVNRAFRRGNHQDHPDFSALIVRSETKVTAAIEAARAQGGGPGGSAGNVDIDAATKQASS
jgi:hypothetical protein